MCFPPTRARARQCTAFSRSIGYSDFSRILAASIRSPLSNAVRAKRRISARVLIVQRAYITSERDGGNISDSTLKTSLVQVHDLAAKIWWHSKVKIIIVVGYDKDFAPCLAIPSPSGLYWYLQSSSIKDDEYYSALCVI